MTGRSLEALRLLADGEWVTPTDFARRFWPGKEWAQGSVAALHGGRMFGRLSRDGVVDIRREGRACWARINSRGRHALANPTEYPRAPKQPCLVPGCNAPSNARGRCSTHYSQLVRSPDFTRVYRPVRKNLAAELEDLQETGGDLRSFLVRNNINPATAAKACYRAGRPALGRRVNAL